MTVPARGSDGSQNLTSNQDTTSHRDRVETGHHSRTARRGPDVPLHGGEPEAERDDPRDRRFITLVSDSATPCGVEAFARRLALTLGPRSTTRVLGRGRRVASDGTSDRAILVINLPVVAWKRKPVAPVAAAARARLDGHRVVVLMHEWGDLDWKRRASYLPLLLLADIVLFSCPAVERSFAAAPFSLLTTPVRSVVPIPPNVSLPTTLRSGPHGERVRNERGRGRTILGHFGSIYPRKRSTFVLDLAAELKARGEAPFVVFAGSFIKGQDPVEREFFDHVRRLGLVDDVLVTGFIAGEDELFDLLTQVDVFAYSFAEGLSTRRASVFACLTAGRPVVVNSPIDMADLDHHPVYKTLLASGLLRLVPTWAGTADFAEGVLAARAVPPMPPSVTEEAWFAAGEAFAAVILRAPRAGSVSARLAWGVSAGARSGCGARDVPSRTLEGPAS